MVQNHHESALADRLRFAAASLAIEFQGISVADAERLIFDVAREFLSDAQVAHYVPTFATRRARQLLRARDPEAVVAIPDDPIEDQEATPVEIASSSTPPRPPAYYASEAKRLLERARALRASTLSRAGTHTR